MDQAAVLAADEKYYGRNHSDKHREPPADWVSSFQAEPKRQSQRPQEPARDHPVPPRRRTSRYPVPHSETLGAALAIIQGYRPDPKHQTLAKRSAALVRRIVAEVPNVRDLIDVMHLWTAAGTALSVLSGHKTTVFTADMAADKFAAKWKAYDPNLAAGDFKQRLAAEVAAAIKRGDHRSLLMHPEADGLRTRLIFMTLLIVERLRNDPIVFLASRDADSLLGMKKDYACAAIRILERLGYIHREPMTNGAAKYNAPRFRIHPGYQDIGRPECGGHGTHRQIKDRVIYPRGIPSVRRTAGNR
ncbi:MAG: hypothetical protein EXS05_23375 [Planctomycetaceae bacterium]|nr:hypothetical protein [Planctomycetaceae bacterium]